MQRASAGRQGSWGRPRRRRAPRSSLGRVFTRVVNADGAVLGVLARPLPARAHDASDDGHDESQRRTEGDEGLA